MEVIKVKERFIELRAKGYSLRKIAKELKKSRTTLIGWSKELDSQIAQYKAIETEALLEQYYLLKESRIQAIGEITAKLREEAINRDFTDVPTDKLLDLILKYDTQLSKEIAPLENDTRETEEEVLEGFKDVAQLMEGFQN